MSDGGKRVQRQVKPKLFVSQFLARCVSQAVQRAMDPTSRVQLQWFQGGLKVVKRKNR